MKLANVGRSARALTAYPAHRHGRWELIYNCSGSGIMTADRQEIPFSDATVVLCPPGVYHGKESADGFEDYYLQFDGCDFTPRVYVLEDDCDRRMFHLMRILHSAFYEAGPCSLCDHLFGAIMELVRPSLVSRPQNPYVQQLRLTIIQEFTNPDFLLNRALEAIPTNPDYLRRQFRQETGQTPHAYLTQLRMEHAKSLLTQQTADRPAISEVAYRSGYYDPLYFSRAFRQYTGASPSRWGKAGKE